MWKSQKVRRYEKLCKWPTFLLSNKTDLVASIVGVRDYIHVVDLAQGHVAALKKGEENCGCKVHVKMRENK